MASKGEKGDKPAGPTRAKKNLTELERHEGWLENLRNEERTMKE